MKRVRSFRDLSLFWKLLLPPVVLIVLTGVVGGFLIVRDLSRQARASLNQALFQTSLNARALLQERELFLLESATLAANLEGMGNAVAARNADATAGLFRSILALKTDLTLLVATTADGKGLVEFRRSEVNSEPSRASGTSWTRAPFVRDALDDERGDRRGGLLSVGDRTALAVAAPICTGRERCGTAGVAVAGAWLDDLVEVAQPAQAENAFTTFYDDTGRLLAGSDLALASRAPVRPPGQELVRRTERTESEEIATLYGPLEIQGQRVGILAVGIPTQAALATPRGAGLRVALLVIAALGGIVGIGVLLTRVILGQVRPLVETNRRLSSGDLSARAPVLGSDELGELATGVNEMATALQASHETLETQVAQRTEEVRRLLSERTEFFASVSHEFRTPLAVILSQCEMLLERAARAKRGDREALETIRRSSEELLGLINDILEITKVEAGRLKVERVPLPLARAIDEMRGTLHGLAGRSELTLEVAVPAGLPMVFADPRRLREVVLNLVDNASKYTPPGGHIRIEAVEDIGDVLMRVSDTGVGIPDAVGDRIFEPFYALGRTQRGEASSGLGLALTKRLVEAQGGTLGFANNPGVGTTFTVRFETAEGTAARRARRGARTARARGRAQSPERR